MESCLGHSSVLSNLAIWIDFLVDWKGINPTKGMFIYCRRGGWVEIWGSTNPLQVVYENIWLTEGSLGKILKFLKISTHPPPAYIKWTFPNPSVDYLSWVNLPFQKALYLKKKKKKKKKTTKTKTNSTESNIQIKGGGIQYSK